MIRILQSVNVMDRAGLETMLMNYYRNIDREKIQFDFLTHRTDIGAYEEEIRKLGGKIFHAPRLYPQNYGKYFKYMKNFFEEHPEYKIIHSHIDTMSAFPLYAAKKNNIPVRIAHSHTSKLDRDAKYPIKYAAKLAVPYVSNHYFSCGELAGKFLFGERKFKIIHNAIDLEKYHYDENIRREQRKKLGLDGAFVVGHVGRYCYIKNQSFLIDVFVELLKERKNAVLLLIGKGEDEKKLREKVADLGLEQKVMFLIDRSDVNQLYQVVDVFVMPSLFEGLPVVGVEAQANGIPCIVSDKISQEILLTGNIQSITLSSSAKQWAEKILSCDKNRNYHAQDELTNKGYNVQIEARKLMEQYQNLYKSI